uniref:G kinase-anchoring protein 1 n=1 Tax=Clastoptera arizonana TaxID=38151 RepID=A0A1B6BZZ8_9HEMI
MVTPVASRYALLALDDEGNSTKKIKHLVKKKTESAQTNTALKPDQKNKKKKTDGPSQANQNQASNKSKKTGKSEGKKKKEISEEQWKQWKERDSKMVDGMYEEELQKTLLASKNEFERNKEFYNQVKKMEESEKKLNKKGKKLNRPISLKEFNNLSANQVDDAEDPETFQENCSDLEENGDLFKKIKAETKEALKREEVKEKVKAREVAFNNEIITLAQYKDRLEESENKRKVLEQDVINLKEELHKVKVRNKKLCELMFEGEMKDKASLLVNLDKLQRVKDELSTEVSSLHAQLEQERSKVRSLANDNKHNNKKKNVKTEASSESSNKEKR